MCISVAVYFWSVLRVNVTGCAGLAASCECLWVSEGLSDAVPVWGRVCVRLFIRGLCDCVGGTAPVRGCVCVSLGGRVVSAWARVCLRGVVYPCGLVCEWDCGCWGCESMRGGGSAPVQGCGVGLRGAVFCVRV